jgi:hypothetical protein
MCHEQNAMSGVGAENAAATLGRRPDNPAFSLLMHHAFTLKQLDRCYDGGWRGSGLKREKLDFRKRFAGAVFSFGNSDPVLGGESQNSGIFCKPIFAGAPHYPDALSTVALNAAFRFKQMHRAGDRPDINSVLPRQLAKRREIG